MQRLLIAIAALLFLASGRAADTPPASLNYSKLADYQKQMADLDQLNVSVRLSSKDPKVKPSDITLEGKLKSGQVVRIPIAADGSFTLPLSPDLAQEDPLFVSNQPRGTMTLSVDIEIKTPAVATQRYADLVRGAAQLNVATVRQGLMQGPKIQGLLFAFDEGSHTLTLHAATGDRVIKSESREQARKHRKDQQLAGDARNTFIYVPVDDDLLGENPLAVFDALPVRVIPVN